MGMNAPGEGSGEASCVLLIRVVPNARRDAVDGMMADGRTLKVRIASPAVDGKANRALIRFLSKSLGLRKADVEILTGGKTRTKRLMEAGMDPDAVRARLLGI